MNVFENNADSGAGSKNFPTSPTSKQTVKFVWQTKLNPVSQSWSIAIDKQGFIYVAFCSEHCIRKYDNQGQFLFEWGSQGTEAGQFEYPNGLAIDNENNIYVADSYNYRIQKFNGEGQFLSQFGSYGDSDGAFHCAVNVATDTENNIYVLDFDSFRDLPLKRKIAHTQEEEQVTNKIRPIIQKFDSEGRFLLNWGSPGRGEGEFYGPNGLEVSKINGQVYVTDLFNSCIQRFDNSGKFLGKWGKSGNTNSEFAWPEDIGIDPEGNVYITDTNNQRIQKFNSEGKFLTKWNRADDGKGQLHQPEAIALDNSGKVYVIDYLWMPSQLTIGLIKFEVENKT